MAYIGKSIESGTFSVLDTSGNTYNGSNTTFNLGTQVGSVAQLLVSHDGVIQKPGTDYSLATGGTQITFSTAPASGASIFIVEISGAVGGPLDSDLNGSELILDADGDTSITADTDDQIDVKIAGADDFKFSANAMNVLSGSTLTIDSGATIANSGTATGFGVALDDVSTGDAASTLATSAGNITVDAQGNDTDIIFKGTDGGADTTFWTMDGSDAGNLVPGSTSTGIYLGVSSATAANLLNDYEEGSWTPTVTTGGANPDFSSGTQRGRYVKVGKMVHVHCEMKYTSSSGNIGQWGGLPFNTSNEASGNLSQTGLITSDRNTTTYHNVYIANDTKWYIRAQGTMSGGLQTPSDFSGQIMAFNHTYIST